MHVLYNFDEESTLHFWNTTFETFPKNFNNLANCLNICNFEIKGWNLMKIKWILPYLFNFQMTLKA